MPQLLYPQKTPGTHGLLGNWIPHLKQDCILNVTPVSQVNTCYGILLFIGLKFGIITACVRRVCELVRKSMKVLLHQLLWVHFILNMFLFTVWCSTRFVFVILSKFQSLNMEQKPNVLTKRMPPPAASVNSRCLALRTVIAVDSWDVCIGCSMGPWHIEML